MTHAGNTIPALIGNCLQAVTCHKNGQLAEAESQYETALAGALKDDERSEVQHLLGVLLWQRHGRKQAGFCAIVLCQKL